MYTVLYVDDEPALLELGTVFLELSGALRIETALSAADAIKKLQNEKYDGIISDYQMPVMDGIAFLKYIRKHHGRLSFILFTGRGREEVVIEALNSGADFYLQKGGDPKSQFVELEYKIRLAIERRQTADELRESRQRMTDIIDHLPDATFAIDLNGTVIAWNRAMEEMTGVKKEQILGTGDHSYAVPFYGTRRPILLDLVLRENKEIEKKYSPIIRKDNKLISEIYMPLLYGGKGAYLWFIASPLYDTHGNITGAIESIRDITDRKRQDHILQTQLDLGLALQSIRGLYDTLKTCLLAAIEISGMDAGGIYLVDEISGSVDLILSQNLGDEFVKSVSQYPAGSVNARMVMAGKPIYIQYKKTGIDHTPVQEREGLRATAVIPVISMDRVIACFNIASHIFDEIPVNAHVGLETIAIQIGAAIERIRADEALAQSEQKYRNVVEDQTEFISRFLPGGTHVFVNEAYCRYFGKTMGEITGTRFVPHVLDEDKQRVLQHLRNLTRQNPVATMEHRIIMPDGQIRWQQWSDRAIFNEQGNLVEYQSVGRDITDRKISEDELRAAYEQITAAEEELREQYAELKKSGDALRESDEQYRSLIETTGTGYVILDKDGRVITANQEYLRLTGRSTFADIEGRTVTDWTAPYDLERNAQEVEQCFRNGQVWGLEIDYQKPDGTIQPIEINATVIQSDSGQIILTLCRDITERKRVEDELRAAYEQITAEEEELRQQYDELARSDKALRTSEGMYRTILNNTGSATIIIEEDTTISFVNPEFERIMKYSKEEVEGKIYWTELVVPDDAEQMNRYHILRRTDPAKAPRNYEFRFITKGQQVRSAYLTIGLIPETKKTVASFVDITEKKQAEEALRESERNYRDILENIQDVYYRSDREGNLIMISPSGVKLMGYDSENEILGRNIAGTVYADPSERRTFLQALEKDGFVNNFEVDLKRPDGTSVTVETSSHKYYDENGNFLGVEGIFRDISGRKRAEGALTRSELTYRTIFENTGTATVLIEENTTISLANAEFERLSGYSRKEIEGKKSWTEFVAKEDLDQMLDQHRLRRVRQESALRHYEFRFITKSGTIRKIFLTIDLIPETKRSVASLMDITGRNRE